MAVRRRQLPKGCDVSELLATLRMVFSSEERTVSNCGRSKVGPRLNKLGFFYEGTLTPEGNEIAFQAKLDIGLFNRFPGYFQVVGQHARGRDFSSRLPDVGFDQMFDGEVELFLNSHARVAVNFYSFHSWLNFLGAIAWQKYRVKSRPLPRLTDPLRLSASR